MKLTEGQREALERAQKGESFKVVAMAGAGKTTTLRAIAEALPGPILYLAFNSSVAREARTKFPNNTVVSTLHSLAFRNFLKDRPEMLLKFEERAGVILVKDIMEYLDLPQELYGIPRFGLASAVKATLERFLTSAEPAPTPNMVPGTLLSLVEEKRKPKLTAAVLGFTQAAWEAMRNPGHPMPLSHEGYVRLWAEAGAPGLDRFRTVLVDEAQDLSPSLLNPLLAYYQKGGQIIAVGDPNQAIYGWRGAVDALTRLPGEEVYLPESFRFGPEVAGYAQAILEAKGWRGPALKGLGGPSKVVQGVGLPRAGTAWLYRTNAGVVKMAAELAAKGYGIEVVGGLEATARLIEAGVELIEGKRPKHPELAVFKDYREFWQAAEIDPNLKSLRNLLDRYGKRCLDLVQEAQKGTKKKRVDYILSTTHKAKGLEWDSVLLGDDYPDSDAGEELNLRYVAATRARKVLDVRHW